MSDAAAILTAMHEAAARDHRVGYPHVSRAAKGLPVDRIISIGIQIGMDRMLEAARAAAKREA